MKALFVNFVVFTIKSKNRLLDFYVSYEFLVQELLEKSPKANKNTV